MSHATRIEFLESLTHNQINFFMSPVDLPLPRFVGLKNEPEMRHAAVPPGVDAQGATAPAPPTWSPPDRSIFTHKDMSAERQVSISFCFC